MSDRAGDAYLGKICGCFFKSVSCGLCGIASGAFAGVEVGRGGGTFDPVVVTSWCVAGLGDV